MMDLLLAMESSQYCTSIDSGNEQDDGSSLRLDERIEDSKKNDIVLHLALRQEIGRLDEREKLLLYYRYRKEYNQTKIAQILNLSQVQISRLENKIYRKLKEKLTEE